MSTIVENIDTLILPRFLLNDTYPYPEGIQLEFKKSFHSNQHSKYRETICAFLNTNGGHIIYGILDNCVINGCLLTENERDTILLFVDSLYTILKSTNSQNIPKHSIKIRFEEIAKNMYIIIITCYPQENVTCQFLNGDSWVRMNASNMKNKYGKLYMIQDVANIKEKYHKRQLDLIQQYTKQYNKCEADTIIRISNILYKKQNVEKVLDNKNKNNYMNIILFGCLSGIGFSVLIFKIIQFI